jgi:hypothetical protein
VIVALNFRNAGEHNFFIIAVTIMALGPVVSAVSDIMQCRGSRCTEIVKQVILDLTYLDLFFSAWKALRGRDRYNKDTRSVVEQACVRAGERDARA